MHDPRTMKRPDWMLSCRKCGGWVMLSDAKTRLRHIEGGPDGSCNDFAMLEEALEFYLYTHLHNYDTDVIDLAAIDELPPECSCSAGERVTQEARDIEAKWTKLLEQYAENHEKWKEASEDA